MSPDRLGVCALFDYHFVEVARVLAAAPHDAAAARCPCSIGAAPESAVGCGVVSRRRSVDQWGNGSSWRRNHQVFRFRRLR